MEYGLIGGKLGHSYSKTIHELLCGYSYELCPLPTEADARAFLQRRCSPTPRCWPLSITRAVPPTT